MTCAPRGIFSTNSLKVGRTARYFAPPVAVTVTPSGWPMMSLCGT